MDIDLDDRRVPASERADPPSAPSRAAFRRLRITEDPVWIEFEEGGADAVDVRAGVSGWPAGTRAAALAIVEFEGDVPLAALRQAKMSLAKVGPYFYLDQYVADGALDVSVRVPGYRIRRIGFRLWGHKRAMSFDDVRVAAHGAALRIDTAQRSLAIFMEREAAAEDVIAVDLLADQEECGPRCAQRMAKWSESMDQYNQKSPLDLGHTDCCYDLGGSEYAAVTAFHAAPAMLQIPATLDAYMEQIGDKSRNMVRKARRSGYRYEAVDPNLHIDDIVAIRVSAPLRQGKPIPASFYERPPKIMDARSCRYHGDAFYGIFKDGRLVAYTRLFLYGQLAQVNELLGHADHLKEGVMNLLMVEVVDDILRNAPWIRAINYLYPGNPAATSGLPLFKRSVGFHPRRLLVAHGDPQLAGILDAQRARRQAEREAAPVVPGSRPAPKLDSAELGESLMVAKAASRDEALATLMGAIGAAQDAPVRLKFARDSQVCASPGLLEARVVVVDGVDTSNIVAFLSAGFKQFKQSMAKNTFVLFDFPRDVDTGGNADPHGTKAYFLRRFKSTAPAPEAMRDGFKGSDFVLRGVVEVEGGFFRRGRNVLLLKKIR